MIKTKVDILKRKICKDGWLSAVQASVREAKKAIKGPETPAVPPVLLIEVTNRCNLKCKMCDREILRRKDGDMAFAAYKKIIDEAVSIGVGHIKLNRFGEPTLNPELPEMIIYAKKHGIPFIDFTTNGTLFNEELSRRLLDSGIDQIVFSFDGATKKSYETVRRGANFEKCLANIQRFIRLRDAKGRKKPFIVIQSLFLKETENEIDLIKKMWSHCADKLRILGVTNRPDMNPAGTNNKDKRMPCIELFDRMLIFQDLQVSVCCSDLNGTIRVGNLRDQSILDIWHGAAYAKIRNIHRKREFFKIPICANCDANNRGVKAAQSEKIMELAGREYL
ncbi:MAG: radical SAM protein [Desulfobacteraceae bacterium]|nr:MAG: radical SAM protein [Desulfobacteraceae bacterium]